MEAISLLFLAGLLSTATGLHSDTVALLSFRSQADPHDSLLSNWTVDKGTANPACSHSWLGVRCLHNRVSGLSLPSLSLRGPIDSLSSLDQLRLLDLHHNRLNGTISSLAHCTNLKLLYLSSNDFSGEIPPQLSSLHRLLRLDLSDNNLQGQIPPQFSNLTRLLTLRLQNNLLSGEIPNLPPDLNQLNLSNNQLRGRLPLNLVTQFGSSAFSGNAALCRETHCSDTAAAAAETVSSTPSSFPSMETKSHKKTLGHAAAVMLIISNSILALVILSFCSFAYCSRRCKMNSDEESKDDGGSRKRPSSSSERRVYASDGSAETDKSRLVFFDRRKQFDLEDLLRASAELLGKGSLGTVYRAVLDDGSAVAVKRLKDANPCARMEFEQYMDVIGRLKHPNIVKLRAYYYAKEEKLLVYDFLPNGSLYSLLHSRGPGRIPLDWTTRIGLILGAARGLARIHTEYKNLPHGNVKSSNVLLDKNGVACISDFGLSLLLNPAHAIARLGGYRAPEQRETKKLSQEADVYSFGVLVLEVLTGKTAAMKGGEGGENLPNWVRSVVRDEWTAEVFDEELLRYKNIEEELVAMLHVATACVAEEAEKRPAMVEVVRMVEEMRVEDSPIGEEYDDSRSSLSPSLATTEEAL